MFDLLIYAYERGGTDEIAEAFTKKAHEKAENVKLAGSNVAIIVDASQSMIGPDTQQYHPIAHATVFAETMRHAFDNAKVLCAGGDLRSDLLVMPSGETKLANVVAKAMETPHIDYVYIVSDGYDNAPEGRLHEVMEVLRNAGNTVPVHQFAPVPSAEAKGVRPLSNLISYSAINNPESTFTSMLKNAIMTNVIQGIETLVDATIGIARQEVTTNA
jgi:hypothetical protein